MMPAPNLNGIDSSMVFWRTGIPIVAKKVMYKGNEYEMYQGSADIAPNLQCVITVKKDEYTTNKGTEIVYRVSLMGFNKERKNKKNNNGTIPVLGRGNRFNR